MAYVPQEAWVQNTSVVDNVCFGQELDAPWLETVLEACALWPDVDGFPAGVHTRTGEQVRVLGGLHGPGRRGGWGPLVALTCEGRIQGRQSGEESRGGKGPSSGPGT